MLRRFSPSSALLSSATLLRFCASSTSTATTAAKKFDPVEFAKEQERRRQTEPRKAFWTPSGATNIQAEIEHLEKQKAALLEKEKRKQEEESKQQQQRQVWGRDTIELVENMQNVSSQVPLSAKAQKPKSKSTSSSSSQKSSAQGGILAQVAASRPLTSRLDSLYKNYSGKDQKTKEAQEELLKARKEQLKWREIDYQLDQVRLDRDLLQWYHYLKRGKDYAIDCELERELRYFPEHVAKELRTNLKFLVGSSRLIKTGPAFPTIQKLTKLSSIVSSSSSSTNKNKKKAQEEDLILPSHFNCPTVVFVSQLAHTSEKVEDIDRYYVPLVREAVTNPHNNNNSNNNNSASSKKDNNNNTKTTETNTNESKIIQKCTQRDVPSIINDVVSDSKYQGKFEFMYLKTADFQSSIWMRKWLTKVHAARINPVLAPRTYTGVRLLRNFSSTLGLRNYGAQYVMLVDHSGKIRWLSTGPPTSEEVEWFTDHCRTLQKLHTVARAK